VLIELKVGVAVLIHQAITPGSARTGGH
jgi:hypothetical protein